MVLDLGKVEINPSRRVGVRRQLYESARKAKERQLHILLNDMRRNPFTLFQRRASHPMTQEVHSVMHLVARELAGHKTPQFMTQFQEVLRLIGEFQFTYAIQDRDHGARSGRGCKDIIAYGKWSPHDHSGDDDVVVDDIVCGVGFLDACGLVSHIGSYSTLAIYDLYAYGYGLSELSYSSGYYPSQSQ